MLDNNIFEILEKFSSARELSDDECNHLFSELSKKFEGLSDVDRLSYLYRVSPNVAFKDFASSIIKNKNGEFLRKICSLISDDDTRFFFIETCINLTPTNPLICKAELLKNILDSLNEEQKIRFINEQKDYYGNNLFICLIDIDNVASLKIILDSLSDTNRSKFILDSLNEFDDNALIHAIKLSNSNSLKLS